MRVLVQPWHTPAGDFSVIGCALGEQSHAGHALWVNQHAKFKESEANLVHHFSQTCIFITCVALHYILIIIFFILNILVIQCDPMSPVALSILRHHHCSPQSHPEHP